jgi:GNAT superfamily N-acetyltransferase
MTAYQIRAAAPGDAPAVAALLSELVGKVIPEDALPARMAALASADNAVFVADGDAGGVLGVIAVHRIPVLHAPGPVGYITALVTAPAVRGRGVGRALVGAAEEWARARGCVRLIVTSAERRHDAHAFYERCGLPYTGRRFVKQLVQP